MDSLDIDEGFVKQDESVFSMLSPEALAALRDLAVDRGIEPQSNENENDVSAILKNVRNHFDYVKVGSKEEVAEYTFGEISFSVKGIKQSLGKTLDSTGLTVWRAAESLCEWMVKNKTRFVGKKVCELGAGLGLVSILLAKLDIVKPPIVCTDGDEVSLKLLKSNLAHTSTEDLIIAQKLYWGEGHEEFLEQHGDIDVIVAADVIYEEYQVEALISTVVAIFQSRVAKSTEDNKNNNDNKKNNQEKKKSPPPPVPIEFYLSYARRLVPLEKVTDTLHKNGLKSEVVHGDVEPILLITQSV